MVQKCHRCIIDRLYDCETKNLFCYTCDLKMRRIRICVVCFQQISTTKELCSSCVYLPTKRRTDIKKFLQTRIREIEEQEINDLDK